MIFQAWCRLDFGLAVSNASHCLQSTLCVRAYQFRKLAAEHGLSNHIPTKVHVHWKRIRNLPQCQFQTRFNCFARSTSLQQQTTPDDTRISSALELLFLPFLRLSPRPDSDSNRNVCASIRQVEVSDTAGKMSPLFGRSKQIDGFINCPDTQPAALSISIRQSPPCISIKPSSSLPLPCASFPRLLAQKEERLTRVDTVKQERGLRTGYRR